MNGPGSANGRMWMSGILDRGEPFFAKSVSRQTHQNEKSDRRWKPTNYRPETVAANPPTGVAANPSAWAFKRCGKPT